MAGNVVAIRHVIRRRRYRGSPSSLSSPAIGGVVSSSHSHHDANTSHTLARVALYREGWPLVRLAQRRDTRQPVASVSQATVPSRPKSSVDTTGNRRGVGQTFFPVQDFYPAMPHDVVMPDELEVGVTELRDSLGFTVRHVAESGVPIVVRRYRRAEVILVPLAEWRRLKQLESDLGEPDPFDFDDE